MKSGQCSIATFTVDLLPEDRAELERFADFLRVEDARRNGADQNACNLLEAAIYADGIGREPPAGSHEA
jgi:hypothetical protein